MTKHIAFTEGYIQQDKNRDSEHRANREAKETFRITKQREDGGWGYDAGAIRI
jgi:hypothetical protein